MNTSWYTRIRVMQSTGISGLAVDRRSSVATQVAAQLAAALAAAPVSEWNASEPLLRANLGRRPFLEAAANAVGSGLTACAHRSRWQQAARRTAFDNAG